MGDDAVLPQLLLLPRNPLDLLPPSQRPLLPQRWTIRKEKNPNWWRLLSATTMTTFLVTTTTTAQMKMGKEMGLMRGVSLRTLWWNTRRCKNRYSMSVWCVLTLFHFQLILTLNNSLQGNIFIEAKIHACRTCMLCLHLGKSITRQQRKWRKGISAMHACKCSFPWIFSLMNMSLQCQWFQPQEQLFSWR